MEDDPLTEMKEAIPLFDDDMLRNYKVKAFEHESSTLLTKFKPVISKEGNLMGFAPVNKNRTILVTDVVNLNVESSGSFPPTKDGDAARDKDRISEYYVRAKFAWGKDPSKRDPQFAAIWEYILDMYKTMLTFRGTLDRKIDPEGAIEKCRAAIREASKEDYAAVLEGQLCYMLNNSFGPDSSIHFHPKATCLSSPGSKFIGSLDELLHLDEAMLNLHAFTFVTNKIQSAAKSISVDSQFQKYGEEINQVPNFFRHCVNDGTGKVKKYNPLPVYYYRVTFDETGKQFKTKVLLNTEQREYLRDAASEFLYMFHYECWASSSSQSKKESKAKPCVYPTTHWLTGVEIVGKKHTEDSGGIELSREELARGGVDVKPISLSSPSPKSIDAIKNLIPKRTREEEEDRPLSPKKAKEEEEEEEIKNTSSVDEEEATADSPQDEVTDEE
jgi:hypothetical protein